MKTVGNILWFIITGLWSMLGWLLCALILAVTIVGLPFARQCVKLAVFSAWPFGRQAVPSPNAAALSGVGQVLWVILAGWWLALSYLFGGIILCVTVIGIPFGLQAFKLAGLAFAPFGKEIVTAREMNRAYAAAV